MPLELIHGKTILVTGAAGGIGEVLCREMARGGNRILALDCDGPGLETVVQALRNDQADIHPLVADVRNPDALASALSPFPSVDILVNNAGGSSTPSFAAMTPAAWQRDLEVNLTGAYHCFEAVRAGMVARRQGVVINVGSANGTTAIGHPAYSAAKAGLINFTQSLALEFGKYGIRANIVLPGTVATKVWKERLERDPAIFNHLKRWYPLKHIVTAEDVAHAVIYLASDFAVSITGAVLNVDGGLLAGNRVLAHDLTLEAF